MKFISLELLSGAGRVLVNAERIAFLQPGDSGGTKIWFGGLEFDYIAVKESQREVEKLCDTIWIKTP